ncbi:Uncharacterised protein [Yersinia kristensenii]|nr:Uncharacterised protein [Yersinia kristensenii]
MTMINSNAFYQNSGPLEAEIEKPPSTEEERKELCAKLSYNAIYTEWMQNIMLSDGTGRDADEDHDW